MLAGAAWTSGCLEFFRAQGDECNEPGFCTGSFLFSGAVEFGDFVAVSDKNDAGAVDKQTVLNDAGDVAKFARERWRVGDAAKVAIEDVMTFVGDEGFSIFLADDYGSAELFDFAADKRQRERDDFDRYGETAEHRNLFAGIGDYDQFARSRCYNFFVKESAAATFDQVEMGVEFVGAIDRDVDMLDFIEVRERNAELSGHLSGVNRSGDAADLESGFDAITDELDGVGGRRAGAEANDLAILNELKSGARGGFFFLFVGHGWILILKMRSDFIAIWAGGGMKKEQRPATVSKRVETRNRTA